MVLLFNLDFSLLKSGNLLSLLSKFAIHQVLIFPNKYLPYFSVFDYFYSSKLDGKYPRLLMMALDHIFNGNFFCCCKK